MNTIILPWRIVAEWMKIKNKLFFNSEHVDVLDDIVLNLSHSFEPM